jgi:hypothetical protein
MRTFLPQAGLIIAAMCAALPNVAVAAPAPNFGPNVLVFDPSMPESQIQATVNAIATQQVSNQFGPQRYALLFMPGTYGSATEPLAFQVGYYTEVAGLGASPLDVVINGTIDVYNQCFGPNNCIALDNFWRSLSNLTINVAGQTGCRGGTDFWAVSQASPLRRVNLTGGNLSFMDYCGAGPYYASGGFMSDSQTQGGTIINGSQQQFFVRNSAIDGWSNGVWNQVFSGVIGAPPQSFPNPPYTTLATSPITRERPFLYVDSNGQYNVFVPAAITNSSGTTWAAGMSPGSSIPIKNFFIATPTTSILEINLALLLGKNLILTPGIYNLNFPIVVTRPDTVVLGLGFATLSPRNGTAAMTVAGARGVKIAGLLFDAGPVNSPALLDVGIPFVHDGNPQDPTTINDVFFRIGGAGVGKATRSLVINSDDVLLDDIWAWRADHGTGVGWTVNTADSGLIVNGDNVTAYGLFVEHYQKTQVIWNGENGRTIMFQNEMPYDPPDQAAWMQPNGEDGYPAYKVADFVQTHEGWGLGSYCNFTNPVYAANAFEVPNGAGVEMHDLLTVFLNGAGGINNVIDNTGGAVNASHGGPNDVVSYP